VPVALFRDAAIVGECKAKVVHRPAGCHLDAVLVAGSGLPKGNRRLAKKSLGAVLGARPIQAQPRNEEVLELHMEGPRDKAKPVLSSSKNMRAQRFYKLKLLQNGQLKDACEKACAAVLGQDCKIEVTHPRHLGPGLSDDFTLDAESLRTIVDFTKIDISISGYEKGRNYSRNLLTFRTAIEGESFGAYANSETSFRILELVANSLGLEQTEEPEDDIESLNKRVAALERAAKNAGSNPKCFISFKFDDHGTVTQVNRLKRLLAAVHIEFLTGEQFEPRRVEDKVKARLRADIDFLVAVITKVGESKWIRDEIADANSRGIRIVLLLEEGAAFDKGIFGTLEHISYAVTIEETFPALLEGVNFIRAAISADDSLKN
jgi:hypothetical protein